MKIYHSHITFDREENIVGEGDPVALAAAAPNIVAANILRVNTHVVTSLWKQNPNET